MLNEDAESRALRLEAQKRQGISFVAIALIGFVYLTYRNPERLVRRPPPQRSKCSGSCTHRMPHALLARTHNLTRELRPSASGADMYAGCGRTEYRRHDQGGHRRSDRHVCGATHLCAHCQNLSAHHGPLAASRCKGRKDGLAAPRSCRIVHGSRQSSYASPTYRWVLRMIWIF